MLTSKCMRFLAWHYTKGLEFYIKRWISYYDWVIHYFSLPLLIKTLFSPWKRLVVVDKSPGFNISRFFERLTFNLISRGIGAVVRFVLFWAGIVLLILNFLGGAIGLIIWVGLPPLGLPFYLKYIRRPGRLASKLFSRMKEGGNAIEILFNNEAGRFVSLHTNLEIFSLVKNSKSEIKFSGDFSPKSYQELMQYFVKRDVWSKEYLRGKGATGDDLILAAYWWNKKKLEKTQLDTEVYYGRPGIALELLYGYTPSLNQYSVDLASPLAFSHRLIGREPVVSQMERVLTGGNSVVLVGTPGVGKKTVTLEFAHRASSGKLGSALTHRRILEFDYNFLLAETVDLNLKKTKLAQILSEAKSAGNTILVIRDIQRLTDKDIEGHDFTDTFEEAMVGGELKIIAIATPTDYERFISRNLRLKKFLKKVEVTPPTKEEAMLILVDSADDWEERRDIVITIPALRKILEGSDKYITEIPFPEKALELLDSMVMYIEQKEEEIARVQDATAVLSEKTGISLARLTQQEKKRLSNLEDIIHKRLINQDAAVELIAKSLRAKMAGVVEEQRPIGSFLFMGPTGVGKTETAKVLARVYYGSVDEIIRFDMAEYAGHSGLEQLIGSSSRGTPGRLTTAIKNKPASLLLLDELEKAPPEVFNLLLSILDEGIITDAFGKKIICRHLFVIATSNAGAEYIRQLVTKSTKVSEMQKLATEFILQKGLFTPEFINRFDGVVVYQPLKPDDLVKIAHLMLAELAENLKKKSVYLQVTAEAAKKLAKDGYEPEFGARPMRRIIELVLGDVIGKAILEDKIKEGDRITLIPREKKDEWEWSPAG